MITKKPGKDQNNTEMSEINNQAKGQVITCYVSNETLPVEMLDNENAHSEEEPEYFFGTSYFTSLYTNSFTFNNLHRENYYQN